MAIASASSLAVRVSSLSHSYGSLEAPVISSVKSTRTGVKVTWGAVANATEYKVYRKTYNASTKKWDKNWTNIGKTTSAVLEYVDGKTELGTKYKYLVKAVNGSTTKNSKASAEITFKISPTPTAYLKTNGIKVKWATVVSADEYRIYRSEYNASTKKWSSFKKVKTAGATTKAWTDTKTKSGTKYKYCIKAVNGKVACDKAVSNSLYFLTQTKAKVVKATTGVKVSWSAVKGASSYKVYRSELKNGVWSSFAYIGKAVNTTSYTDTTVTSGVEYKYKVKATKGSQGQTSPETAVILYLAAPKVTAVKGTDGINVTWTESAGATEYVVYRKTYEAKKKKWSSWEKQKTTKAPTVNWTDKNAKSVVKYKYIVKAKQGKVTSSYVSTKSVKR